MHLIVVIRRRPGWYDRARTRWRARHGARHDAPTGAAPPVARPGCLRPGDFDILLF